MAFVPRFLFLSLLALSIIHVKCDDEDLVRGINQYRTSLNLTALTPNVGAECLADEVAERFRTRPCNNTIVPLPRPSDYPDILTRCNLNAATVNDSQILPICVPDNEPDLVLLNRTMTQYMSYLNRTQFLGIGVGSEDDWTVVVLTTSTPSGSSPPGSATPPSPGSGSTTPGSGSTSPPGNGSSPPPGNGSTTPGSGSSNPAPGSGNSNPSNGVSSLIAISPITVILIGLFVLV